MPDQRNQGNEGVEPPAEQGGIWSSPLRLVLVGAVLVAVFALLLLGSDAPSGSAILLTAAAAAASAAKWGPHRVGAAGAAVIVIVAAAVVAVISLLYLIAVLFDLDDLDFYGGGAGLLFRVLCAGGAAVLLAGASGIWRGAVADRDRVPLDRPERLARIGGLVVVAAWALMLTSAWILTFGQAFGVAAATAAAAIIWAHSRGALSVSTTTRSTTIVSLAALTVAMAVGSLIRTLDDWSFLVEFGGLRMILPYLGYLAGAAVLGAGGVLAALILKRSADPVQPGHLAALAVVALAALLILATSFGGGGGGNTESEAAAPATTDTTASTPAGTGVPAAAGPDIPPIDGCALLADAQVEEALGVSEETSGGLFMFSGREACSWQPTIDGERSEDLFVAIGPGDPNDLLADAERDGVVGVPVADVGAHAVWFGDDGRGALSVAESTPFGYALVSIELGRPDTDDPTRLEAAKLLAASALASLRGDTPQPVEAVLCNLVTDAEAEEILAPHRDGRAAARDEVFTIGPSFPVDLTGSVEESCQKLILTEIYIEVATGTPADFEPGAEMDGISGEPVAGVGDEAVWFAGLAIQDAFSAPHEKSVLAVRSDDAYLRIGLSLPDTDPADLLATAQRLASGALTRLGAGGAEVITIDHVPPDISDDGYVGNLLAREEAGEWTRSEGLVATLGLLVGAAEPADVLRQPELASTEATGIVNMARSYIAENPDSAETQEMERLLEILIPSNEQLEEMAGIEGPTAALAGFWPVQAAAAASENCQTFFTGWQIPGGIGTCLEMGTSEVLEASYPGEYRVFGPAQPFPTAGWQDRHFDLTVQAMEDAVPVFKSLGAMPPVNIVFSVVNDPGVYALASPRVTWAPESLGRPCGVSLFTSMQPESDDNFKQIVAHELAHCLHGDTFPAQYTADVSTHEWWDEGLAEHLGSTVNGEYANNNLEWHFLDKFDAGELATGVLDRSYENFIFFQRLSGFYRSTGRHSSSTIHSRSVRSVSPSGSPMGSTPASSTKSPVGSGPRRAPVGPEGWAGPGRAGCQRL